MKIKSKLIGSYLLITSCVLFIGLMGIAAVDSIDNDFHAISKETIPVVEELENLRFAGLRIVSSTSEFGFIAAERKGLGTRDTTSEATALKKAEGTEVDLIAAGEAYFFESLGNYTSLLKSAAFAEKTFPKQIEENGRRIIAISDQLVALKQQNKSGMVILERKEALEEAEKQYLELIKRLLVHQKEKIDTRVASVHSLANSYSKKLVVTGLGVLLGAIAIGLLLSRHIVRPLSRLGQAAVEIGKGNLDFRISTKAQDELGVLAVTFNNMIADLKASRDELQRHRTHLEELVGQRTSALMRSHKELQQEISQRQYAETDKRRLESELTQAHKMEAIGTLAGGIAHDFNNILSAVLGFAELVQVELPDDSQAWKDQNEVIKAGKRARDLVTQILAFSHRREDVERYPVQMPVIVKEVLQLLRASMPVTIEIRSHLADNQDTIMADPSQLHQVIMNLCTNAYHSMREGGGILEISLTSVTIPEDDENVAQGLTAGPYAKLRVSDTGKGMDGATLARIFEPYFTTKEIGEGTGLGLSVVHGIVESHSGQISCQSAPGQGTVFELYFPRIVSDPAAHVAKPLGPAPRGNESVLVVDDEEPVARMVKRLLDGLGYDVTVRTSSIEAFENFKENPAKYDLVITDMTMPNMTGDMLVKKLLAIRPDIPIILCTGFSETMDEQKAKAMGIDAFVMKPVDHLALAQITREQLDRRKTLSTLPVKIAT